MTKYFCKNLRFGVEDKGRKGHGTFAWSYQGDASSSVERSSPRPRCLGPTGTWDICLHLAQTSSCFDIRDFTSLIQKATWTVATGWQQKLVDGLQLQSWPESSPCGDGLSLSEAENQIICCLEEIFPLLHPENYFGVPRRQHEDRGQRRAHSWPMARGFPTAGHRHTLRANWWENSP